MKAKRALLCAGLTAAVGLGTALPTAGPAAAPDAPAQAPTLTGQFLVATPELSGPVFLRTVIYMIRHDPRGGAMGLIVNRQLGEVPLAVLLEQSGLPNKGAKGSVKVNVGGPVEATRVFVLHTDDWTGADTTKLAGGLAVTSQPDVLQAIAAGTGPRRARFTLGYAGWAPGQLEAEIEAGYWVTVPSDSAIIFDDANDTKWDRAMSKRRINL